MFMSGEAGRVLLIYTIVVVSIVFLLSGMPARIASIPLFVFALWHLAQRRMITGEIVAMWISGAVIALPLLQLVPLPPEVWTRLPGRDFIVVADTILGEKPAWRPLSLDPAQTMRALLFMLPAFAVYYATLALDARSRRLLALVIVILATVSVPLGLAQVAGGVDSPLRPLLGRSHGNVPVGFFANRNHFAALLYAAIPLTVAGIVLSLDRHDGRRLAGVVGGLVIIATLLLGAGMSASRSGVVLSMLALAGSAVLIWRRGGTSRYAGRLITVAVIIGAFLVLEFGLARLLARAAQDPLADARFEFLQVGKQLAGAVSPAGTGIGAFAGAYAMYESLDLTSRYFVDYLHNDWMQIWIEGGALAAVVGVAFLAWFGWRCFLVWRHGGGAAAPDAQGRYADDSQLLLARAATISIALLMGHAVVEYHLRGSGMECVLAILLAMLTPAPRRPIGPGGQERQRQQGPSVGVRHSHRSSARIPAPSPRRTV